MANKLQARPGKNQFQTTHQLKGISKLIEGGGASGSGEMNEHTYTQSKYRKRLNQQQSHDYQNSISGLSGVAGLQKGNHALAGYHTQAQQQNPSQGGGRSTGAKAQGNAMPNQAASNSEQVD